ncbi:MAG: hypothetical protein JWN21_1220 [Sphingomonas bacterium]|uniref:hypothetical protein n=1 Tax=Sphingomonas bacterium TaxID=1895847 RepID=UPI002614D06C|nr:hypothetical protein [Sphingomonas bacterium]MDB5695677.1 hypothetical protein [Sphingomonas bacterium]
MIPKTLKKIQPGGAWADVRYFFGKLGEPHQLLFLLLALATTALTLWALYVESYREKEYKREIIYVQQWRLDRTDAEIVAQQKIDGIEQTRRIAEEKRLQEEQRLKFKKIDDKLKKYGI